MEITSARGCSRNPRLVRPQRKAPPMNDKTKNALKAGAVAAGLVAVLLPTGCSSQQPQPGVQRAPGSTDTVVVPPTVD